MRATSFVLEKSVTLITCTRSILGAHIEWAPVGIIALCRFATFGSVVKIETEVAFITR